MKTYVEISKTISKFNQSIEVPGDKSISIRLILLASQAFGKSRIFNLLNSDDVKNTIKSIKSLGIKIKNKKDFCEINGLGLNGFRYRENININAGNSGTFARLFCGSIVRSNKTIKIIGDRSLSRRDFSRIIDPLRQFGVKFTSNKSKLPLKVRGNKFLTPISYKETKGSAQVKSAILLAALHVPGETIIKCPPSRDHTENLFKYCLKLPIKIKKFKKFQVVSVKGQFKYSGFNYKVPSDISSASFFIVLTLLSKDSKLIIKNVNVNKSRAGIIEILNKMNAKIKLINKRKYMGEIVASILIESSTNLKGINCPKNLNTKTIDEFLIIFLVCARADGISTFRGIQELRQKESDRLKFAANFLKMIGVKVIEKYDSIKIYGNKSLKLSGKYVVEDFLKDHRVFMMSCVAALTLGGNFKINDKSSINSSFPNFVNLMKKLGAKIN